MKELTDLRTEKTKLFDLENGRMKLVAHQHPIHYKKVNMKEWEDIDTSIGTNKKINKCPYDIELLKNKVGYKGTDFQGKKIELELTGVKYVEPIIEGNKATYVEVEKDVDFVVVFGPRKIQANRILKSDKANKTSVYRSFREEGITGKVLNLGVDKEGRNTKLKIIEQKTGKKDEKFITQIFDGKVMKMNPVTRKREWSDDVTYPVVIDPTTTTGSLVDDGQGYYQRMGPTTIPPLTATSVTTWPSHVNIKKWEKTSGGVWGGSKIGGYLLFEISNIPKGSTIDSATLSIWGGNISSGTIPNIPIIIAAKDSSNPNTPTLASSVITPDSIGSAATTTFTNSITKVFTTAQYVRKDIDVQSMVNGLVTKYDYSANQPMLFFVNLINMQHTPFGQYNVVYLYQSNFGINKDAELTIEFTLALPSSGIPLSGDLTILKYGEIVQRPTSAIDRLHILRPLRYGTHMNSLNYLIDQTKR